MTLSRFDNLKEIKNKKLEDTSIPLDETNLNNIYFVPTESIEKLLRILDALKIGLKRPTDTDIVTKFGIIDLENLSANEKISQEIKDSVKAIISKQCGSTQCNYYLWIIHGEKDQQKSDIQKYFDIAFLLFFYHQNNIIIRYMETAEFDSSSFYLIRFLNNARRDDPVAKTQQELPRCAPELKDPNYSSTCDIWEYGKFLFKQQLNDDQMEEFNCKDSKSLVGLVNDARFDNFNFIKLIRSCIQTNILERPTMLSIVNKLIKKADETGEKQKYQKLLIEYKQTQKETTKKYYNKSSFSFKDSKQSWIEKIKEETRNNNFSSELQRINALWTGIGVPRDRYLALQLLKEYEGFNNNPTELRKYFASLLNGNNDNQNEEEETSQNIEEECQNDDDIAQENQNDDDNIDQENQNDDDIDQDNQNDNDIDQDNQNDNINQDNQNDDDNIDQDNQNDNINQDNQNDNDDIDQDFQEEGSNYQEEEEYDECISKHFEQFLDAFESEDEDMYKKIVVNTHHEFRSESLVRFANLTHDYKLLKLAALSNPVAKFQVAKIETAWVISKMKNLKPSDDIKKLKEKLKELKDTFVECAKKDVFIPGSYEDNLKKLIDYVSNLKKK